MISESAQEWNIQNSVHHFGVWYYVVQNKGDLLQLKETQNPVSINVDFNL